MEVYIGTVHRGARVAAGGELIAIDWATKRVRARVPIHPTEPSLDHDPNPRGNSRGCRGILFDGPAVVASDYHTLRFYDRELRPLRTLSHGLMVGIHEVHGDSDGTVWVTSTELDAALRYDLRTGALLEGHWPREVASFQRELDLVPLDVDKSADQRAAMLSGEHLEHPSHLHLNAVATWKSEVYALFNSFGAIANLTRGEIVLRDPRIRRGHNLVIREDGLAFVSDTHGAGVRCYDLARRELVRALDLRSFAPVRRIEAIARADNWLNRLSYGVRALTRKDEERSLLTRVRGALQRPGAAVAKLTQTISKPLFVRGLALAGEQVFVSFSPATVLRIDWPSGRLIDVYSHSWSVDLTIHGLAVRD
jgi:hypothetical protein